MEVEAGWQALKEARWSAALHHFQRADESPEACEGLSWAAWWLDDADTVFHARGRAYALYKQRSNAAAAGRCATWLACDYLDFRGAASIASGWLARAHRLLDPLPESPEHGWLAFFD